MKKNKLLNIKPAIMMAFLVIFISFIGVGYAYWSGTLTINSNISTGTLDVSLDDNCPISVQVISTDGYLVTDAACGGQISCTFDNIRNQACISVNTSLYAENIMGSDRLLMMRYPLILSESSTVQSVMLYQADLTGTPAEQLRTPPVDVRLLINGNEYLLPESLKGSNAFDTPLEWDVYRQIEIYDNQLTGVIFLKLSDESVEILNFSNEFYMDYDSVPPELLDDIMLPDDETTVVAIQAEIGISYSLSVSLFIEQNH